MEQDEPQLGTNQESFEEFRDRLPRMTALADDAYIVEGDIRIHGDDALYEYWKKHHASGALVIAIDDNGQDIVWNATDKLDLRYCVGNFDTPANTARIVAAMKVATAEWEARAGVKYIHVANQDGAGCTNQNNTVRFNVQMVTGPNDTNSFIGPYAGRAASVLTIHQGSLGNDNVGLAALIGHELGHGLGFPHEHGTPTGPCPEYLEGDYRWVTAYDNESIMHYTWCMGRDPRWWSKRDREGAASLYGPGNRGKSDILWRNSSTNGISIWTMNGGTATAFNDHAVAGGWLPVGTGDLNLDYKDDIVWRHTDGTISVWLMDGGTYIGGFGWSNSPSWSVVAVADVDGDDRSEIVLRNGTLMSIIFLTGNGSVVKAITSPSQTPPNRNVIGTGDFDRNGTTDLLFGPRYDQADPPNAPFIWLMNGATVVASGVPATATDGSVIKGIGDFNGDGRDDILRQVPATGALKIWYIDKTLRSGNGYPPTPAGGWSINALGDFNGDWKADIFWRNGAGTTGIWFMDGANHFADGFPPGPVGSEWQIKATPDFN